MFLGNILRLISLIFKHIPLHLFENANRSFWGRVIARGIGSTSWPLRLKAVRPERSFIFVALNILSRLHGSDRHYPGTPFLHCESAFSESVQGKTSTRWPPSHRITRKETQFWNYKVLTGTTKFYTRAEYVFESSGDASIFKKVSQNDSYRYPFLQAYINALAKIGIKRAIQTVKLCKGTLFPLLAV